MRSGSDGATHFRKLEVVGDIAEFGNGVLLEGGPAGFTPQVNAIGDDASINFRFATKTAGVHQDRLLLNGIVKTIVDGSATSLFDVACPAGTMSGGVIHFLVRASDGTDHQAIAGMASYACENKAGTLVLTITYVAANEAKAVSAGTLTLAFTFVTGTSKGTVKVQPTGSLTETTYTIEYNVYPIRGAVSIL